MADLSQTIKIIFEGVDNSATVISDVNKGFGDLATSAGDLTQPLADAAGKLLLFETALVGVGAVFASQAIQAAADFDDALYEIKKAADDTSPSLEDIKQDVEDTALAYGIGVSDVALAVADFMKSGKDYETSAGLVNTATKLMISGGVDAKTATDLLTASLAGFRVPAKDAATEAQRVGDVINKLADISPSGFTDIADGFKLIAPTAHDAGISMEEAAAAITTITDKGIPGAEAANALKSGLLTLIDPAKDAAQKLDDLGVAVTDNNGVLRPAGDILKDLAIKYGDLTAAERLQTAAVIFGKDQAGKLNILLGDWGISQKYVADMLDETTGAFGSMDREVSGKIGLLSTAIDQAGVAWDLFLIALGGQITLGGGYQDLVTSIGGLGTALKTVLEKGRLDPLFQPLRDAFTGLSDLVDAVALNLPKAFGKIDWTGFENSIDALGISFSGMFDDIDITTVDGLSDAIQLVIDVGAGLINTTSGLVTGLQPLFDIVGLLVTGFTNLSPEMQKAVGWFFGMGTTVNVLSGYAKTFSDVIGGASGLVSKFTLLNPLLLAAGALFAGFEFGKWLGEITGYNDVWDKLVLKMNGVPDAANPAADALKRIPDNLKKISDETGFAITSMEDFNQLADDGKIVWDDISGAWVKAGTATGDLSTNTGKLLDVTKDLNPLLKDQYDAMGLAADGTKKLDDATDAANIPLSEYEENIKNLVTAFQNGDISANDYYDALIANEQAAGLAGDATRNLSTDQDKAAKSTKDLTEESEKFALEWGKLLSAERIAVFEASADIQVAQIEADSKRAVAAMEMLGNSFVSTGEVLTDLIGLWVGLEGMDQTTIQGWIEREYAIREALAQAQIDMVNAEIRRLEAQTALLERGGVELKITSDGMEPELEAFMFRIIDKVRVSVAGSYEEFLLGCGA